MNYVTYLLTSKSAAWPLDYQTLHYWLGNRNWLANYTLRDDVTQDWLTNLLNKEVSA
jgi:hypothetical protein